MIGLYKDNTGIHGINFYKKVNNRIINENNLNMFYKCNGVKTQLPKDQLIINLDNLTFSQTKLVNTCLVSNYSLYNDTNLLDSFGNISSDISENNYGLDPVSKTLRINKVNKLMFRLPNLFSNSVVVVYATMKINNTPQNNSRLLWFSTGKSPRLQYENNQFKLMVANIDGQYEPHASYGTPVTINSNQYFNITWTIHNTKVFNLYLNGNKFCSNLGFTGGVSNNFTDIVFGDNTLDLSLKTFRVYKRMIVTDEFFALLTIDKLRNNLVRI